MVYAWPLGRCLPNNPPSPPSYDARTQDEVRSRVQDTFAQVLMVCVGEDHQLLPHADREAISIIVKVYPCPSPQDLIKLSRKDSGGWLERCCIDAIVPARNPLIPGMSILRAFSDAVKQATRKAERERIFAIQSSIESLVVEWLGRLPQTVGQFDGGIRTCSEVFEPTLCDSRGWLEGPLGKMIFPKPYKAFCKIPLVMDFVHQRFSLGLPNLRDTAGVLHEPAELTNMAGDGTGGEGVCLLLGQVDPGTNSGEALDIAYDGSGKEIGISAECVDLQEHSTRGGSRGGARATPIEGDKVQARCRGKETSGIVCNDGEKEFGMLAAERVVSSKPSASSGGGEGGGQMINGDRVGARFCETRSGMREEKIDGEECSDESKPREWRHPVIFGHNGLLASLRSPRALLQGGHHRFPSLTILSGGQFVAAGLVAKPNRLSCGVTLDLQKIYGISYLEGHRAYTE